MATWYWKYLVVKITFIFILSYYKCRADEIVHNQLPFCKNGNDPPSNDNLVIVSTLDGKLSAFSLTKGKKEWVIKTEPLLSSNIHHTELTLNGEWARLVPSLSGSLYRLTADHLQPLPLNVEHLLSSSFKYSDDLVFGGARETRWLGVEARSGRLLYQCGSGGCNTDKQSHAADAVVGELLVLRHNMNTVRALDPKSGTEKWNFSVSEHQLSLSEASQCHSVTDPGSKYKISMVVPDGLVQVFGLVDELLWEVKLSAPVAGVWRLGGGALHALDFGTLVNPSPSLYIGLHEQQLYVQESLSYPAYNPIEPGYHLQPIEWKPVEARQKALDSNAQALDTTGSTALATLYKHPMAQSEKSPGYFLFATQKMCDTEHSNMILESNAESGYHGVHVHDSLWYWWKEVILIAVTSAFVMNLMFWPRYVGARVRPSTPISLNKEKIVIENHYEVKQLPPSQSYTSRYLSDFKTKRCIGRGGFGVVFQATANIDQRSYAVKRIMLPQSDLKKERVLREVYALAHLEHENIVRYYGSWVEAPPPGWQKIQDLTWMRDVTATDYDAATTKQCTSTNKSVLNGHTDKSKPMSVMLNMQEPDFSLHELSKKPTRSSNNDSFNITFKRESGRLERSDPMSESGVSSDFSIHKRVDTVRSSDITSMSSNKRKKGHKRHWSLDECVRSSDVKPVQELPREYLYIQMQLCHRDLRNWLRENTNIPNRKQEITNLFNQIVSAVEYVHNQGLIHRDLKPSNILFAPDGRVKVGDFGLVTARADGGGSGDATDVIYTASDGHTNLVGTHLYMSPEQMQGKSYSYKVDIYSLGIILFELLQPFHTEMERARTLQELREGIYPKDFVATYPHETETLKRMLTHEPRDRYTATGVRHHAPLYQMTEARYHYSYPNA